MHCWSDDHDLVEKYCLPQTQVCWTHLLLVLKKKKKKIYLLLAALGFCCCVWAFFNCGEGGHLLVVVGRLLIVMASFAAKYRL